MAPLDDTIVPQVDPDIITGYNINSFDLWYIVKRAEALKQPMALYLSRTKVLSIERQDGASSKRSSLSALLNFTLYRLVLISPCHISCHQNELSKIKDAVFSSRCGLR